MVTVRYCRYQAAACDGAATRRGCHQLSHLPDGIEAGSRPSPYLTEDYWANRMISTEISTAGTVPLFSSQWVVFLSSGQPTPGP